MITLWRVLIKRTNILCDKLIAADDKKNKAKQAALQVWLVHKMDILVQKINDSKEHLQLLDEICFSFIFQLKKRKMANG